MITFEQAYKAGELAATFVTALTALVVAFKNKGQLDEHGKQIQNLTTTAQNHDTDLTRISGDVGEAKGTANAALSLSSLPVANSAPVNDTTTPVEGEQNG